MGAPLERETIEYWGWIEPSGGRSGGRRSVGRAGRCFLFFYRPLVNALLQRGLLNIGCSLGDGVCALLGVLLDTKAVEHWVLFWRGRLLSAEWIGRARAGRI